jgi:hypothetical protein
MHFERFTKVGSKSVDIDYKLAKLLILQYCK